MTHNPFDIFHHWFNDVKQLQLSEPTAMTLATIGEDGYPSARIVLLKHADDQGFCFYTNLTSRKGKELLTNPKAALCFFWDELHRQVRVEGNIERVTEKEADDYFASRSRGSQLGAWASKQSCAMENETDLADRLKKITEEFKDHPTIPRPPFWSGFRLKPHRIEFWEEGQYRLHKRTVFTKSTNGGWQKAFLYP